MAVETTEESVGYSQLEWVHIEISSLYNYIGKPLNRAETPEYRWFLMNP